MTLVSVKLNVELSVKFGTKQFIHSWQTIRKKIVPLQKKYNL